MPIAYNVTFQALDIIQFDIYWDIHGYIELKWFKVLIMEFNNFIQDLVSKIFYIKILAMELLRINAFNDL